MYLSGATSVSPLTVGGSITMLGQKKPVFSIILFLLICVVSSLYYPGFRFNSVFYTPQLITPMVVAFFMLIALKTLKTIYFRIFYLVFGLLLLMHFILAVTFVFCFLAAVLNIGIYAEPKPMGYFVFLVPHVVLVTWGVGNIYSFRESRKNEKANIKSVKRTVLITALAIIIISLLLVIVEAVLPIKLALSDTKKMMDLIKQGNYSKAAAVIGFSGLPETKRPGYDYQSIIDNIPVEKELQKERFIHGITDFFSNDVKFVSYNDIQFDTDFYIQGSVIVNLETDSDFYCFRINIYKYTSYGKLYPASVDVIAASNEEKADLLANKLKMIIKTFSAG